MTDTPRRYAKRNHQEGSVDVSQPPTAPDVAGQIAHQAIVAPGDAGESIEDDSRAVVTALAQAGWLRYPVEASDCAKEISPCPFFIRREPRRG